MFEEFHKFHCNYQKLSVITVTLEVKQLFIIWKHQKISSRMTETLADTSKAGIEIENLNVFVSYHQNAGKNHDN